VVPSDSELAVLLSELSVPSVLVVKNDTVVLPDSESTIPPLVLPVSLPTLAVSVD
jgi:hypothetical protein